MLQRMLSVALLPDCMLNARALTSYSPTTQFALNRRRCCHRQSTTTHHEFWSLGLDFLQDIPCFHPVFGATPCLTFRCFPPPPFFSLGGFSSFLSFLSSFFFFFLFFFPFPCSPPPPRFSLGDVSAFLAILSSFSCFCLFSFPCPPSSHILSCSSLLLNHGRTPLAHVPLSRHHALAVNPKHCCLCKPASCRPLLCLT